MADTSLRAHGARRRRATGWSLLAVVLVSLGGAVVLLHSSPTYSPPPALSVVR
jgi:hypothetical protein